LYYPPDLKPGGDLLKLNRKLVVVSLIYFAEGFPFGIIEQNFPVYFRVHGMSLAHIGLLSLMSLPYALKFLWAPAVDFIGMRRQWISAAQFAIAASILLLLPLDPAHPGFLLWTCIACLAIASATQDIAIDAYSIELLKPSEMGIANGFRQAAYRVAMLVAGGLFVSLGGRIGWELTYSIAAGLLALCSIATLRLPAVEVERPAFSLRAVAAPIKDILQRPGLVHVALFILLYKLGDMAMGPMVRPFWLASGLSLDEIGLITGTLGILASIVGGLTGGFFMVRYGTFHGLWFLGLWQSLSNLTYVWIAVYPQSGHFGVYVASAVESFCAGLGTSAFLAFLMSISKKEFSATQYAIFSALFRVTGIIAGSLSGWATEHMGYAHYFALTFFLSLPAFFFIFYAKRWIPPDPDVNGTG
jgi:MFS transporter, PAT family, beta-lactamase induction signal transducer AmpG